MKEVINFLSNFPFFESEKNLFLHMEEFLVSEYQIRPLLVFSIQDKFPVIHLDKCRTVLGKADRLQLYSAKLLDELIIQRGELKTLPCLTVKVENCFYYYLNLGLKRNQFYFTIFSSPIEISTESLKCLSSFMSSHLKIVEKFDELYKGQELIHIDDVTGLYNQRKLYKDLASLVEKYQNIKDSFCVLFIDIDHFKRVNDNYGHLIGTKLLENVAKDIKGLLRDSDISYRYGGDEFVIILVDSDGQSGKIVGERILAKICSQDYSVDFRDESKIIKLSVSIGVAEFPTDAKNAQEVLAIADRMMYEAKESGRGLVFNTQDVFKSSLKKIVKQK
ncbi:MAG: GGDEF domain-containing protein [Bacteriovorax sp.]|nr:GGDEF domain-containing protein [Bacteriovorax sp.]